MRRLSLLLLTIVVLSGSLYVFSRGMSTYLTLISGAGKVKALGVGVYWDLNCTERVTLIDWGIIEPGASENRTVYVKNEGNAPIVLYLNTTNWNPPETEDYLTLTWNYSGENLEPLQVLSINMTLTVAQNVTGITNFTFDITVVGEG